jgi:hypothetical protein
MGIGECYHMRDVPKNSHQALWVNLMKRKFEEKKQIDRKDFEPLFAGFEVWNCATLYPG